MTVATEKGGVTVRPVRTEADYTGALELISALMDAQPEPGTEEFDQLDVLATLVEAYEKKHHPIPRPDGVAAIRHLMDRKGMNQSDLASVLGVSRGRASEILNRRRSLSLSMIRSLRRQFGISADVLIGDERLELDAGREHTEAATPAGTKRRPAKPRRGGTAGAAPPAASS